MIEIVRHIGNIDPNSSNQSQDVDMLPAELEDNESESDRIRIAVARLAEMQDGESEIGKLNYIREIEASLKYFRSRTR
jgi:hypothetical protein